MGLITLLIFPLLSLPVLYFTDRNFWDLFTIESGEIISISLFLSIGIFFGLGVIWMSELPYFEKSLSNYKRLLTNFDITYWRAFYLSVCAGVGEEIFFRGAIQPLLGIVLTAVLFVGIHGYFSLKDWKVSFFALLLTGFIMILGWAAQELSLWHAIAGHFSYDLVLLLYLSKQED
jgi:membrane protease YdiL (CAAX protease family)